MKQSKQSQPIDAELAIVRDAWPALRADQRRYLSKMATGMAATEEQRLNAEPTPAAAPKPAERKKTDDHPSVIEAVDADPTERGKFIDGFARAMSRD